MNIDRHIAAIPDQSPADRARVRTNAEGWLASEDPAKRDAAARLIAALDAHESAAAEAFERTPLTDRVVEAFRRRPWSDHEGKLIQALLDHPGSTTTELNRLSGLGENMVWQMHFGNMCKALTDSLGPPPPAITREGPFWSGLLAQAEEATNRFTMKPDAVAAFAQLGLKASR